MFPGQVVGVLDVVAKGVGGAEPVIAASLKYRSKTKNPNLLPLRHIPHACGKPPKNILEDFVDQLTPRISGAAVLSETTLA
jgi:hypothetical protein